MASPFGVGDFIAVTQLAYKIYDGCKSSAEQFRNIGRDVGSAYIALNAIEAFWKNEESKGRKLIGAEQEDLKQLTETCQDILEKLEQKLEKHKRLGDKANTLDKIKWYASNFAKDVGPLRGELQSNTNGLALFNATLTARYASGQVDDQTEALREQGERQERLLREQGELLEYLVTRYFEFQTGKNNRIEPAFSQVAVKDITEDEGDSWKMIDDELGQAGFDLDVLRSNRGFIRNWIGTVIPEEDEEEPQDSDSEASHPSRLAVVRRDTNRVKDTGSTPVSLPPTLHARPASPSSHRSKSPTWRDDNANDTSLPAKLLSKVLRSKYGEDHDDLYLVPIQRAFHQIDWTGRGWLDRGDVERYCKMAGILANFQLDDATLTQLVKLMDKDADYQITMEEFTDIVMKIRRDLLDTVVRISNYWGLLDAGVQLKTFFDGETSDSMLPSKWQRITNLGTRKYRHELQPTPQVIAPLQKNFTNAAFLASSYCATQITTAFRDWRTALMLMTNEEAGEYKTALNDVLKATSRFHFFDTDQHVGSLHPLDHFWDQLELLPLDAFNQFSECPAQDINELLSKCWNMLDLILGFVYDLKQAGLKQMFLQTPEKVYFSVGTTPPSLAEWRRLRMLERSRMISRNIPQWDEMKQKAELCRKWWSHNSDDMTKRVEELLETSRELYDAQQEAGSREATNKIKISGVSLNKLRRKGIGIKPPTTTFKVFVDGEQQGHESRPEKSTTPLWYYGEELTVNPDSTIRLTFYDQSDTTVREIGVYDFKVTEITNFEGYSNVTKHGSFQNERHESIKIEFEVTTSWELGKKSWTEIVLEQITPPEIFTGSASWRNATRRDPAPEWSLAASIIRHPLPDHWEPRRTKDQDVYFINTSNGKQTASLWWDPLPTAHRSPVPIPLPLGWTQIMANGKLSFTEICSGKSTGVRPPSDKKSLLMGVLCYKEYCQIGDFFPEDLIAQYQADAERKTKEASGQMIPLRRFVPATT